MNWQAIIDMALETTGTKIADLGWYPSFSKFLDVVHKMYYEWIKEINEDFLDDRIFVDFVAFQNAYDLGLPTSVSGWIDKILRVGVKYQLESYPAWDATATYNKYDRVIYNNGAYMAKTSISPNAIFQSASFVQLYDWYVDSRETTRYEKDTDSLNTQSVMNSYEFQTPVAPRHILQNNTLYVFPWPQNDIAKGLKIDYVKWPADIDYNTAEADIPVPRQYHWYLAMTLRRFVFMKEMRAEEINAKVYSDEFFNKCINDIRMRNYGTITETKDDLSYYR